MAELDEMRDSPATEAYFAAKRLAYQNQFRAEGERNLLRRQAAHKFGYTVAEKLASALEDVADADAETLARAGEWIVDSGTGEELVAHLGSLRPA